LSKFKVAVRYEGGCCEEILEIEADSAEKARRICSEMISENNSLMEEYSKKGIYISKVIKECRLHQLEWRDELNQCANMSLNLENDV
jgi:hypothetical protein